MKSKLFSPSHEVQTQSPLGKPEPFSFYPEEKRFGNAQHVPEYSCFGAGEIDAVPQTPIRRK